MKAMLLAAFTFLSISASAAPSNFDREYAFLKLADMGYDVAVEEMGEMFRDNIFIFSNSYVCSDLNAKYWDDSRSSCLLQVLKDGSRVIAFPGDGNDSVYE